jgi:hypothetical protein
MRFATLACIVVVSSTALCQSRALADLPITVIVQNEVTDGNGAPKAITEAIVFLSESSDGSGTVLKRLKKNGNDISVNNPLAGGDQSDDLNVPSRNGFKRVQLRYRLSGGSTNVFSGACIVSRGQGGGNDHYMQQVIIRPRSLDGRQTQFQPEDQRKPRTVADDRAEPTEDTIYLLNRMYSPVNVFVVGPDGGIGRLYRLAAGTGARITNCPPWEFAISAFSSKDNSLQHVGRVTPSLVVYELLPNREEGTLEGIPAAKDEPTVSYEPRKEKENKDTASTAADGDFQGTSKTHDFHEALDAAIAAAKIGLDTTLIHWKLLEMSGEDGGFAQVHDLTLSIHAWTGPKR